MANLISKRPNMGKPVWCPNSKHQSAAIKVEKTQTYATKLFFSNCKKILSRQQDTLYRFGPQYGINVFLFFNTFFRCHFCIHDILRGLEDVSPLPPLKVYSLSNYSILLSPNNHEIYISGCNFSPDGDRGILNAVLSSHNVCLAIPPIFSYKGSPLLFLQSICVIILMTNEWNVCTI